MFIRRDEELTGNTNNLNIVDASYIALNNTSEGSVDLTGLTLHTHPDTMVHKTILYNISVDDIVIKHNSASSSAGNKIFTQSGLDVTLSQWDSIEIYHVDVTGRHGWQQI